MTRCGADAPQCAHFSTVIAPSWITQQISLEKCAHRGVSGAPNNFQNCHLDKTVMDKTSQHSYILIGRIQIRFFKYRFAGSVSEARYGKKKMYWIRNPSMYAANVNISKSFFLSIRKIEDGNFNIECLTMNAEDVKKNLCISTIHWNNVLSRMAALVIF